MKDITDKENVCLLWTYCVPDLVPIVYEMFRQVPRVPAQWLCTWKKEAYSED